MQRVKLLYFIPWRQFFCGERVCAEGNEVLRSGMDGARFDGFMSSSQWSLYGWMTEQGPLCQFQESVDTPVQTIGSCKKKVFH